MSVNADFRDLFAALNDAGAEFLIVGGYALAVHGAPRFTKDLDVWIRADLPNARRVWAALETFGAPLGELTTADLASPGIVFQMGLPPNRIDLLTAIDGVEFESAWTRRIASRYGDQPVGVIGLEDLVRNKEATGRPQDALDAKTLRRQALVRPPSPTVGRTPGAQIPAFAYAQANSAVKWRRYLLCFAIFTPFTRWALALTSAMASAA